MPCASISTNTTVPATADAPKAKDGKKLENPILDDYLRNQQKKKKAAKSTTTQTRPVARAGELSTAPSSLFLPERTLPGFRENMSPGEKERLKAEADQKDLELKKKEDRELIAMNTDPDAEARRELERQLVISGIERRGRMTKAEKIKRTERESLYRSKFLPTSTKKMQKVINQIAGKTVSEALVQLRFSPKKIARDVIKGLEIAQNEAIISRGMGLENGQTALARWQTQRDMTDTGKQRDIWDYRTHDGAGPRKEINKSQKNTMIELKDGSKKLIRDPSELYIDQAWVGRGESWNSPEFRARGQINTLIHRTTSTYFHML